MLAVRSQAGPQTTDLNPPIDPDTELPAFFSARRVAYISGGAGPESAKLLARADSRLAKGDRDGARKALEEATTLDGKFAPAQFALASMYEASGMGCSHRAIPRGRHAASQPLPGAE